MRASHKAGSGRGANREPGGWMGGWGGRELHARASAALQTGRQGGYVNLAWLKSISGWASMKRLSAVSRASSSLVGSPIAFCR